MLPRADLDLIPALAALLDQRHVTRAAESIGIGQPAMSSALASTCIHWLRERIAALASNI